MSQFRLFPHLTAAAAVLGLIGSLAAASAAAPAALPAPAADAHGSRAGLQTAVLAGGCFWGLQGVFEHVRGVRHVLAGYAGGASATAHYDQVGTGRTGHAESVQVTFDPAEVSYAELLRIYFSVAHDPTELNRQGPDAGTQYRSAIFYADDAQRDIAQSYITQLGQARSFARPIVTQVDPLTGFYPAEDYHQDFYLKHPAYPYIVFNDLPKIRALERLFPQYYRDSPARVATR